MKVKLKNAKELSEIYPKLDEDAKSFLLGYGEGYIAAKENEAKNGGLKNDSNIQPHIHSGSHNRYRHPEKTHRTRTQRSRTRRGMKNGTGL